MSNIEELPVKVFRTVKEKTKPEIVEIIGSIPDWVNGHVIRNGPAKWDFPNFTMNHAFDGYTMISKFEVRGGKCGKVSYTSKFLQSESFKKAQANCLPVTSEFGTRSASADAASKKSALSKMFSALIPQQSDNTPFICTVCKDLVMAIGDTGFMHELDIGLNSISRIDPVKELGLHSVAAHPITDPETGVTYLIGISLIPVSKWNVIKFPKTNNIRSLKDFISKSEVVCSIPCRNKQSIPWFHSFGMTKSFLIIIDQPSYFNVSKMVGSMLTRESVCPMDLHEWKPEQKNRFYFVHKQTGKFAKTEILSKDAFFYFHILNCYEQENHLVIDLFGMPKFSLESLLISNVRAGQRLKDKYCPRLLRFVIPIRVADLKSCPMRTNLVSIRTKAVAYRVESKIILEPEVISGNPIEMAAFNKKCIGKPIRYIWGTGTIAPSSNQHKLYKFDMKTRETLTWEAKSHQFAGEPMFLAHPQGKEEDDGVIVVPVVNYLKIDGEKDFLIFLNAKNLHELGRATFDTEIPLAIHSVFVGR